MTDTFPIGRLGKPHGVKGEITFHFTDDIFDRVDADYVFLEIDGLQVPFFFEEYRFRSETTALVKFDGIDDATRAADLIGCTVFFPRELSDEEDGELSWAELVGFTITNPDRTPIGEVTAIDLSTINTLFEVRTSDGRQILIPANDDLIDDLDRENRTIAMRIPEGLLGINY